MEQNKEAKPEKDWQERVYKSCNNFYKLGESELVIGKDLIEYG